MLFSWLSIIPRETCKFNVTPFLAMVTLHILLFSTIDGILGGGVGWVGGLCWSGGGFGGADFNMRMSFFKSCSMRITSS